MLRREFMMFVGGASALPLKAIAQARKWRIGFLHPGQSVTVNNRILAFREGLGASGPGEDPEIVVRIANERLDQLPAMAADLVGQNVQAICAVAPPAVRAARDATSSIPIIAMDLESIVRDMGHEVTGVAVTRDEAVALAMDDRPGLVLAYIQLADDSSGIDAVKDILAEFSVPVIFITAFPERLLTGTRPEPTFLITKPFQRSTVKAAIAQALFFDAATVPAA